MKAILITIGNEVLNGQVVDTNAAWLAQQLLAEGIPVVEKWSVSDDIKAIVQALQQASGKGDIILTTGGLGPTADDLTSEAFAQFMHIPRVFHAPTYEKIETLFNQLGRLPGVSHLEQARLPEGVEVIPNSAGTAPGMHFLFNGKHFIAMPGVPFEMKAIFDPHVKNLLRSLNTGPSRFSHTFHTAGEGETFLEDLIKDITRQAPSNISLAFLPDLYKVRIRVDLDSDSLADQDIWTDIINQIRTRLAKFIVGEADLTLEKAIGRILTNKGWMLGTAESCTGGHIAHLITSNAGASDYYQGSIVAYHNQLKVNILKVNQDTLDQQGAVSEETVKAMAMGALDALKVDVALAVTGIAGPTGGSPEKPVGTVWICAAFKSGKFKTKKIQLRRDRLLNIQASSTMALIVLYRLLMDE